MSNVDLFESVLLLWIFLLTASFFILWFVMKLKLQIWEKLFMDLMAKIQENFDIPPLNRRFQTLWWALTSAFSFSEILGCLVTMALTFVLLTSRGSYLNTENTNIEWSEYRTGYLAYSRQFQRLDDKYTSFYIKEIRKIRKIRLCRLLEEKHTYFCLSEDLIDNQNPELRQLRTENFINILVRLV